METNAFLTLFEKSLIKNGFTKEAAHYHTVKVQKSLSPADKAKIDGVSIPEEVDKFAYSYTRRVGAASKSTDIELYDSKADTITISKNFSTTIGEKEPSFNNIQTVGIPHAQSEELSAAKPTYQNADNNTSDPLFEANMQKADSTATLDNDFKIEEDEEEFVKIAVPSSATKNTVSEQIRTDKTAQDYNDLDFIENNSVKTQKIDKIKIKAISKEPLSANGKKEYAKRIALAAVPAGIALLLISLLVILGYILIAALIAFFIAILVCVTVIGGVSSLAGFIYGTVTLFSAVPEGIYEIGFSLVILAVTLALAILSYNIAVRFIPVLWNKYTSSVTKELIYRLRKHLNNVRRECNKV